MGAKFSHLYPDAGNADALKIQGYPVRGGAPVDGQALIFDEATKEWVPQNQAGGGPVVTSIYIAPDGSHWQVSVTNDGQIVRTKL